MTSGELTPNKPRHDKLWWEIRITAAGLALLAMVIGGYQLWEIALKPLEVAVTVTGEADPAFEGESTAEWLVRRLAFRIHLTETNEDVLSLPAGVSTGRLRVTGRHQRKEIEDRAVVAVAHLPGSERSDFELTLRPIAVEDGAIEFSVSLQDAEAYCRRNVETFVVIRDQREAAVRGLRSVGRVPVRERRETPGTYDIRVPLENLLFVLEGDGQYIVAVRLGEDFETALTVPAEWFLREGQRSRVLSLELPGRETPPPPPPKVEEPAEPEPTPPPSGAVELPESGGAEQQRRARIAELEQGIEGAIGRGQWSRAEGRLDELAGLVGPSEQIRRWRGRIGTGRAEEEKARQVGEAADTVGAALVAQDWDAADAAMAQVRELAPQDDRLEAWQATIDEGRKPAIEAIEPEPEPTPPSDPIVDEDELVRQALNRYVTSQNTLDWSLFVSVYPSIASSRQQIERAWSGYRSQSVDFAVQSIRVFGDTAVVQGYRTVAVVPKVGGTQRNEGRYEFTLGKSSGAWIIETIAPLQ